MNRDSLRRVGAVSLSCVRSVPLHGVQWPVAKLCARAIARAKPSLVLASRACMRTQAAAARLPLRQRGSILLPCSLAHLHSVAQPQQHNRLGLVAAPFHRRATASRSLPPPCARLCPTPCRYLHGPPRTSAGKLGPWTGQDMSLLHGVCPLRAGVASPRSNAPTATWRAGRPGGRRSSSTRCLGGGLQAPSGPEEEPNGTDPKQRTIGSALSRSLTGRAREGVSCGVCPATQRHAQPRR